MFATQVLTETLPDDSSEENIPEIVGLIIVDNKKYELKRGETKIGRDSSMCSIVIENFTVSKVHAVIESEGVDDSFIYDVGSTNQTRLGKKILKPHCRYKLDDNSILTLGSVTAKFVIPPDKNSGSDSQSVERVNLDDLGDIFDLPTQVGILQPNATEGHEKLPKNFQIFKIPNSVQPEKPDSKSCKDEPKQCKINKEEAKQQTVYCASPIDNSHIFSLDTQCQIRESPSEQNKCVVQAVTRADDTNKNSESDKVTSLLNDGQDDVLCTFMSLHSPKEQSGLLKEINIKTEIESLSQVLDAPTQAQVEEAQESISQNERKELNEILENDGIVEEFFSRNSSIKNVTSTPVNSRVHLNYPSKVLEMNDSSLEHADEDYIGTQEFNINQSESNKERQDGAANNLSQNEETQPYVMDNLNESRSESKSVDEDFIFTQPFEMPEKDPQSEKIPAVIPETEDFIQTQIFAVENESRLETRVGSPSSPDREIDSTVNFTQRNDEDDFIETQAFEEADEVRDADERSDRNESDDDEDFIATQKIELPGKISNNCQTAAPTTAFRESSPDLLASDTFSKNMEDFVSTQIFDAGRENGGTETQEQTSSRFKEIDCNVAHKKVPVPEENSGDETESDLEIILENNETTEKERCLRFIKTEQCESLPQAISEGNDDSNSSYVFVLEPENNSEGVAPRDIEQNQRPAAHSSDSDATDCEEIAMLSPKILVKEEPKEKVEFDETQVLTLTLPNDFAERPSGTNDDWMALAESPKFEVGSPLSLEMPNTQEIESTVNKILQNEKRVEEESGEFVRPSKIKKTEVGINSTGSRVEPRNLIDSPIKRPLDSNNAEVTPLKKLKTEALDRLLRNSEKQLSKLVQAHDITQIQPGRTRNSLKNLATETKREILPGNNINNERPTSRRKANPKRGRTKNQNGDITPYLTRTVERLSYEGRKRERAPSENQPVETSTRVLRSSMRNAIKSPDENCRRSRRRSRTKDEEYFHNSSVNIVFTGFECQILEKIISDLGGKKTNDLASGEVVVADKVRRTVKFLSAMGLGLPIASPQWLLSSKREKKFLNPWNFILKDDESEELWDFELKASLEKSKKSKLLQGFSIFATKNTKPPVKDLLAIVEFCGGTPLFDFPEVWPKKTIIVSCLEDKKWWPVPKFRNVKIVHYEFILSGVLRQKIDFKTYKLR